MEKGNAIIRNLDLEAMVTPRFLYDKLLIEKKYLEMNQENMGKSLMNTFDLRFKEVTDNCQTWVQDRVSKREYTESNGHMLALIRDAKELGTRSRPQPNWQPTRQVQQTRRQLHHQRKVRSLQGED